MRRVPILRRKPPAEPDREKLRELVHAAVLPYLKAEHPGYDLHVSSMKEKTGTLHVVATLTPGPRETVH